MYTIMCTTRVQRSEDEVRQCELRGTTCLKISSVSLSRIGFSVQTTKRRGYLSAYTRLSFTFSFSLLQFVEVVFSHNVNGLFSAKTMTITRGSRMRAFYIGHIPHRINFPILFMRGKHRTLCFPKPCHLFNNFYNIYCCNYREYFFHADIYLRVF